MTWHVTRLRLGTAGAALISVALALLAFTGMVSAHAPKPSTISLTPTGSLSIQASGTWAWNSQAGATTQYFLGYAIDWGDTSSGNDVGTYHIGDGTAATDVVLQNVSPAAGSSGTWGPTSHTYAAPGTYTVCVLMYDLGLKQPPATTGWQSTLAGGPGHNADNSVEELNVPAVQCASVQVAAAATPTAIVTLAPTSPPTAGPTAASTPTPFSSFQGSTAGPVVTAPATSTAAAQTGGQSPATATMLLVASALFALVSLVLARRSAHRS